MLFAYVFCFFFFSIEYIIPEHPTGGVQDANGTWNGAVGLVLYDV